MFDQVISFLKPLPGDVVQSTLDLAIEIAREGREGRRIGTLFALGAAKAVLQHSRSLILDPLALHPESLRKVCDTNLSWDGKGAGAAGWSICHFRVWRLRGG